ncbi:MAG: class I SAM-dependent RNA methyltransferase [Ruminococcaceae bacterium]|nr:class I SAM-dependent RNA methyltransferase [Oscillospiraceae bacterium]
MKMEMVATCLFGLERLLGEEIDALGCKRIETMDGRVTFEGDEYALAAANIRLRCAERIFIKMGSFRADNFDSLFEGVKALPWEMWIGKDDAFPVKGHAIRSKLFSVPDCQSIVKKAIVDRLSNNYGIRWFTEEGVKYQVEFFIFKDIATLMIDTSGTALHKRGYRPQSGEAPLRETLAAAMAIISRPREDVLFWDPFCGSGTIAIEAAMLMSNCAPGLNRNFAGESFPLIASDVWDEERDRAVGDIVEDSNFEAYASDIDESILEVARENAKRAGVADRIKIFKEDATKIKKLDRKGTIVCNPPYGERLMTVKEVELLYKKMGETFAGLSPWQIYILTSAENFERLYGRRADKVRKLYNGMIPCGLYQYFKNYTNDRTGEKKGQSFHKS